MEPSPNAPSYWIAVASADHVAAAVAGGWAALPYGRPGRLRRLAAGDGLLFYSPRASHPDGEPVQAFTAIGRVRTDVAGVAVTAGTTGGDGPALDRVDVDWLAAAPAPIRPLLADLSFIRRDANWGVAFHHAVFRIPEADFVRIAEAMGCAGRHSDEAAVATTT